MNRNRVIVGMWVLLMAMVVYLTTPASAGSSPAGGTTVVNDEVTMPKMIPSSMVQPVYPEQEKKAGIEGFILLGVEVAADGTVASIKPEQEVPNHPAFTASAMAAVGKWRFEPAQKDGEAIACSVNIPVRFALDCKKDKDKKAR